MSSISCELIAHHRTALGKSACKKLRRENNQVPAVIYGGKEANFIIYLNHDHIVKAAEQESFYSQILHLDLDGTKHKVLLKDLQRHPFKPKIIHLDFQRVNETDQIIVNVPLHFIAADKSPGVKLGGIVNYYSTTIKIRCEARLIPEFIEVDLAALELGKIIHLSDLNLAQGLECLALTQGKDSPLVSIELAKKAAETEENISTVSAAATAESKDKKEKAATPAKSQPGKSDKK